MWALTTLLVLFTPNSLPAVPSHLDVSPSRPHTCILHSAAWRFSWKMPGNFQCDQCRTPAKNSLFLITSRLKTKVLTWPLQPGANPPSLVYIPLFMHSAGLTFQFFKSTTFPTAWSLANFHSLQEGLTDSLRLGLPVLDPMLPNGAWSISS